IVAGADHPLAHLRAVHHDAEGTAHAAAALRARVEDRLMLLGHLLPGRDGRRSRHSGLLSVFLSGFYSSLDVAADDGAVSLPVSDQGSNAYTDVNTLLEQHAGRRPDKIVVESPDQDARITYGELEALTRRFANFLADEGVRPGDRISLLSDNGIEPLIVFWGALRAGVIVNPVNVEIREKHVSQILHDVAPTAVFWSRELPGDPRALATGGAPWIPFGRWNAPSAPADDLFARLRDASPAPVATRPARHHGVDVAAGIPTVINMLLARPVTGPGADLPALRFMTSSTAPLSVDKHLEFEKTYGIPIVQLAGGTETGFMCGNHPGARK